MQVQRSREKLTVSLITQAQLLKEPLPRVK